MTIRTVQFVNASEVFQNHPSVWTAFYESDPGYTWGNNNHTLASRDMLISELRRLDADEVPGVDAMIDILSTLEIDTFIDLEN